MLHWIQDTEFKSKKNKFKKAKETSTIDESMILDQQNGQNCISFRYGLHIICQ